MRSLSLKVILFLLPVLVIILLLEIALRTMPNDYKVKNEYLDQHADEMETLILGSSHAYYGIDPAYFSGRCYNAAFYSQTLRYDFEILDKYGSAWKQLKAVILPVSYFTLYSQLETGNSPFLVKKYKLYFHMEVSRGLKDRMELLGIQARKNFKKLADYYISRKDPITCSALGWGTTHMSTDNKDLERTGMAASQRHTALVENAEESHLKENLEYLRAMAAWCEENGVKLLLFTPPAFESYAGGLKEEHFQFTIRTVQELVDSYYNCSYINMINDPDFQRIDFYDADHMNEIGTRKLSLKLDSLLFDF